MTNLLDRLPLRSRLFWKIFIWFWGATVLIGLSLYFFVLTTQPDAMPPQWRRSVSASLSSVGKSMAAKWEKNGQTGLADSIDQLDRSWQHGAWLYNAAGQELSGNKIPGPPPGVPFKAPPPGAPTYQLLKEIALKALTENSEFQMAGPAVIAAQSVHADSGKEYAFVALIPPPNAERTLARPEQQIIGGTIALMMSFLICFGLVRYLTSPLIKLREATQHFADGNLSARTDAAKQGRRDEVADLGRDFDVMAGHIETLVESQRQLLGDISHELRSPLTRLNMALALSRRCATQDKGGAEMQAALDRIGRETKRLDALIGQLLELARLESDGVSAKEDCDIQSLLLEIIADANFEAEVKQCSVQLLETQHVVIHGTKSLLYSAFENIIRNAIRHTAKESSVEVRLNTASAPNYPDYIVVKVRDHGAGVPVDSLNRLFHPFYRVEAARDRNSGGVGLGLAITKRAIELHGGEVIANNHPQGGLEVEVRLPLTSKEA